MFGISLLAGVKASPAPTVTITPPSSAVVGVSVPGTDAPESGPLGRTSAAAGRLFIDAGILPPKIAAHIEVTVLAPKPGGLNLLLTGTEGAKISALPSEIDILKSLTRDARDYTVSVIGDFTASNSYGFDVERTADPGLPPGVVRIEPLFGGPVTLAEAFHEAAKLDLQTGVELTSLQRRVLLAPGLVDIRPEMRLSRNLQMMLSPDVPLAPLPPGIVFGSLDHVKQSQTRMPNILNWIDP